MTTQTQDSQSASQRRWALIGLALSLALSSLSTSITNVALPTLAQVFSAPFQDVQWIVLANLLMVTTLVVSSGRVGDLVGRRRLLLAGLGVFTAASGLCAIAPNLPLLIAARAVQGVGAAVLMALTTALVSEVVTKEKTGSAMGALGTASAVGTALGPSLGGVLIAMFDWRAIFNVMVVLGIAAFVVVRRFLPSDRPAVKAPQGRFDYAGTLVLAFVLAAYALAMTLGRGTFGSGNIVLLVAALAGVVVFLRVEARAAAPLVKIAVFRTPALRAGFMMSALVMTVAMATMVVGPFYLSGALELDAMRVGLVLSVGPIVAALSGVPSGRLVDHYGARGVMTGGLIAVTGGAVLLAIIPAEMGVPGYVGPLVILTAGYALFQAANNTAVMADVASDQRGVISGLLNLSRNLGLITGAAVMGAVFALAAGGNAIASAHPEAVADGLRATFICASVLSVAALMICLRSSRH